MPRKEVLPRSIADLTRRHAIELSDTRWRHDVDRLVRAIGGLLSGAADDRNLHHSAAAGRSRTSLWAQLRSVPSGSIGWCRHPYRIDDAALSLIYAGRGLIVIEALHLVAVPFHRNEVVRAFFPNFNDSISSPLVVQAWAVFFMLFGGLMMYVGRQTMRRSMGATFGGLLLSSLTLAWTLWVWTGLQPFTMGGLLASRDIRAMIFMILTVAMLVVTFLYGCAVPALMRSTRLSRR